MPRFDGWIARPCAAVLALGLTVPAAAPAAGMPEVLLEGRPGAAVPDFAGAGRAEERAAMVREQIAARDVDDPAVLQAMRKVPRHRFVPPEHRARAYADRPLPIGHRQTISQPYIVAYMTQLLRPAADDRVLEVGTGSAYQAAILGQLVDHVVSIEIVRPLAESAAGRLRSLGYGNITVVYGDGYGGWPPAAPFDAIIVTAAPEEVPPPLIEQLARGGRMVIPVGPSGWTQDLVLVEKNAAGEVSRRDLAPVRFVPLTGDH